MTDLVGKTLEIGDRTWTVLRPWRLSRNYLVLGNSDGKTIIRPTGVIARALQLCK